MASAIAATVQAGNAVPGLVSPNVRSAAMSSSAGQAEAGLSPRAAIRLRAF